MFPDEHWMLRALQVAKNGIGITYPNPMVGAIIVYNEKIIGEGFTSSYGGPHAEVNAIRSVKNKTLLQKSTLYVTLEPCNHFGKTPPCTNLIIDQNIPKIVIGCKDDNPEVAGTGIDKLKQNGCLVKVGVLEKECKAHHSRFLTYHRKKRPYIILKWAESSDGYIAPKTKTKKEPVWITNVYSRQLVHKWRAEEQAILVGTKTVMDDNPSLNVRDWAGKNPFRIVLDKDLKLALKSSVFKKPGSIFVIHKKTDTISKPEQTEDRVSTPSIKTRKTHIIYDQINWSLPHSIAQQIASLLYKNNINSVIIEGGARTLQTFIDENIWDEARVFTGANTLNGGIKSPKHYGNFIYQTRIKSDTLRIYANN